MSATDSNALTEAKNALLNIVATKFDLDYTMNWRAETPLDEFDGVRVDEDALVDLDGGDMPLHSSLHLLDLGPFILSSRLIVLKLTGNKVKGVCVN
jgi:hypothetical protein